MASGFLGTGERGPGGRVRVTCRLGTETENARKIFVINAKTQMEEAFWIPLSQILEIHHARKDSPATACVVMTRWIAEQRGLS